MQPIYKKVSANKFLNQIIDFNGKITLYNPIFMNNIVTDNKTPATRHLTDSRIQLTKINY